MKGKVNFLAFHQLEGNCCLAYDFHILSEQRRNNEDSVLKILASQDYNQKV